jgi:TRAP-type C4-dicarboxylate transport system permease small subunit
MDMNRTAAIVITVITAVCCGCLALFSCIFGVTIATGQPVTTTINGEQSLQTFPVPVGLALLCVSLILVLIPVAVGFFTLRQKPAEAVPVPPPPPSEPLPPTS